MRHRDLPISSAHLAYRFAYADEAERVAATGFGDGDLTHLALQRADHTLWLLKGHSPPEWAPVGGGNSLPWAGSESVVNELLDFIPEALHAGIYAGTNTEDLSPFIESAITQSYGMLLFPPKCRILVKSPISATITRLSIAFNFCTIDIQVPAELAPFVAAGNTATWWLDLHGGDTGSVTMDKVSFDLNASSLSPYGPAPVIGACRARNFRHVAADNVELVDCASCYRPLLFVLCQNVDIGTIRYTDYQDPYQSAINVVYTGTNSRADDAVDVQCRQNDTEVLSCFYGKVQYRITIGEGGTFSVTRLWAQGHLASTGALGEVPNALQVIAANKTISAFTSSWFYFDEGLDTGVAENVWFKNQCMFGLVTAGIPSIKFKGAETYLPGDTWEFYWFDSRITGLTAYGCENTNIGKVLCNTTPFPHGVHCFYFGSCKNTHIETFLANAALVSYQADGFVAETVVATDSSEWAVEVIGVDVSLGMVSTSKNVLGSILIGTSQGLLPSNTPSYLPTSDIDPDHEYHYSIGQAQSVDAATRRSEVLDPVRDTSPVEAAIKLDVAPDVTANIRFDINARCYEQVGITTVVAGLDVSRLSTGSLTSDIQAKNINAYTESAYLADTSPIKNAFGLNLIDTSKNYLNVGVVSSFPNLTSGAGNCVVGVGTKLTSGLNNTIFGKGSGAELTSGSFNNFAGALSGQSVTTGSGNTAVGNRALAESTTIGVTTGSYNVAIGARAGCKVGGGTTDSVFIGSFSGVENEDAVGELFIRLQGDPYSRNCFIWGSEPSRLLNIKAAVTADSFNASAYYVNGVPLSTVDSTALHKSTPAELGLMYEKYTPVSTDILLIEDSENSWAKKKVKIENLPGSVRAFATYTSGEISGNDNGKIILLNGNCTLPTFSSGNYYYTFDTSNIQRTLTAEYRKIQQPDGSIQDSPASITFTGVITLRLSHTNNTWLLDGPKGVAGLVQGPTSNASNLHYNQTPAAINFLTAASFSSTSYTNITGVTVKKATEEFFSVNAATGQITILTSGDYVASISGYLTETAAVEYFKARCRNETTSVNIVESFPIISTPLVGAVQYAVQDVFFSAAANDVIVFQGKNLNNSNTIAFNLINMAIKRIA